MIKENSQTAQEMTLAEQQILAALSAVQFMTVIPIRLPSKAWLETVQSQTIAYYPAAGLLIALLLSACSSFFVQLDAQLHAALVLSLWVFLSGGLHLDGLADSFDALLGGLGDKEKSLLIMKDPAAGPHAVVALSLLLLLKFAALTTLVEHSSLGFLFAACLLSRGSAQYLMMTTPYSRSNGLAKAVSSSIASHHPLKVKIFLSTALSMILIYATSSVLVLALCLLGVTVITVLWRAFWLSRIDGYTGDTVGALIELSELGVLIICAVLVSV